MRAQQRGINTNRKMPAVLTNIFGLNHPLSPDFGQLPVVIYSLVGNHSSNKNILYANPRINTHIRRTDVHSRLARRQISRESIRANAWPEVGRDRKRRRAAESRRSFVVE